ncbi:endoplasmic reticulum-Golgi intermediate compartment protein 1-like isoform X2 [Ruditapes philippinarum]|uniref:endoplasmic reticulum-Golgi intermediate compartment protein 1-like isoform X2 n=1 Tax=Ruditapes philippinarum TaxID=129788 RepID=UPI00295C205E|nr:endoplasmic reticulum-Golgi intermediate compartment protein 1-like isoform X2 [Ruditapes philippinarum]
MQFDIRRFDIYRKVPKDLTQPTLTGACISICSVLFMLYLFLSELAGFLQHEVVSELIVDDPVKYSEKIPVFLNITLMNTKCEFVGLDIQDDMGRHEVGFQDNTEKIPQNEDNGCRMETHFLINKVPGNFHVSTHAAKNQPAQGDMRHVVHKLRFGMDLEEGKTVRGSFNPMESLDKTNGNAQATHDYIIRVVPSVYVNKDNSKRFPYQYTYSYREKMIPNRMPAVWFKYEMSPITVRYTESQKPFYHFLTTVCAIVGGTFTVAGIFDSCVFTAYEIIRKAELGKLS